MSGKGNAPRSGDLQLLITEVGDQLQGAAQRADEPVQHILRRYVAALDLTVRSEPGSLLSVLARYGRFLLTRRPLANS